MHYDKQLEKEKRNKVLQKKIQCVKKAIDGLEQIKKDIVNAFRLNFTKRGQRHFL